MQDIQALLDKNTGPFLELPPGEYQGNFVIRRPCTIIGNHTVLWAEQGTVLTIDSNIVTIEHLRIEALGESVIALSSGYEDTRFHAVEVSGKVEGILSGHWTLPKVLELGELPSEKECTFYCQVEVPVACKVISLLNGVKVTPEELSAGRHTITLHTEKLHTNTCIYGDILFVSDFIRRSYVTGIVSENVKDVIENTIVYEQQKQILSQQKQQYITLPQITWHKDAIVLQKGQRIAADTLENEKIEILFEMEGYYDTMEIDPYVFLLYSDGKTRKEQDLIFFGNEVSQDGSVSIKERTVTLQLQKVSKEIERISIAYGIYEGAFSFENIKNTTIKLQKQGKDSMVFPIEDLKEETTITAVDFYRYKGKWKISAIGAGYKKGLKVLCESYGLEIE